MPDALREQIADLSDEQLEAALRKAEQARAARDGDKLSAYRAYPKQREFHTFGATRRERLFSAGNQLGKTLAGAMEAAMHLTGRYPDWWQGRRWNHPTRGWVGGPSAETTRDNAQLALMGMPGKFGTGAIPADAIASVSMGVGIRDQVDTVQVRHASGGRSEVKLKNYEQGVQKWAGATRDWLWLDEEPPPDIYGEALARIAATGGMVWISATPLLGMSKVQKGFYGQGLTDDKARIMMTIEDALHIPEAERARIIAGYPPHEREARTKGIPMRGSGLIFPVAESVYTEPAFAVPSTWPQLGALDFGWDHPTAAVRLAWDREVDCVYVTHCYRVREATPVIHAAALKAWGPWLPWAWPHDGLQHSKDSGETLAQQYRRQGLRMLPEHAQFEDGGYGVEAGLMDLLDRLQTGRLKVFAHLADWFEEVRMYHRKDGRVVKEDDDLVSATRYGCMSLRFAAVPGRSSRRLPAQAISSYDPLGFPGNTMH